MERAEIKRIANFLSDVNEGICESDGFAFLQLYLTELYRVIKILMDATTRTRNKGEKIILASLEYKARKYKEQIEQRLAVRN